MGKKAEEAAAWKSYPYEGGIKGVICEDSRQIFIQGYEQALKDVLIEIGRMDSEIPRRYFSKPSDYTLYTNKAKVEAYGELKACIESWIKSTDERESVNGEN